MFGLFKREENTSNEITEAIHNGAYLVDVRSRVEFMMGSAPGAVNIPVETIMQQLDKLKNKKSIVLFCRSGSRSGMALQMLKSRGFTNVYNGGTWQNVKRIAESA